MNKIHIKKNLQLSQICRLLPTAKNHELCGYITPTHIFYEDGSDCNCRPDWEKAVSFHTHPTSLVTVPSESDIYNFLRQTDSQTHLIACFRHAWMLHHTKKSIAIGKQIHAMDCKEMNRCLRSVNHVVAKYYASVLKQYGFNEPKTSNPTVYITNLRKQIEKLGLEVEIIRTQ